MLTVHVLNLKRRAERRQSFSQWNTRDGLNVEFVEAVDGQQLQFADLVRDRIVLERYRHFTAGALGCACSHKMMWEHAVRTDQPLFVCEDDVILRGDFVPVSANLIEQLPLDWDFVTFGYNFDSVIDVDLFPNQRLLSHFSKRTFTKSDLAEFVAQKTQPIVLPLNNTFGLCAYAVSPTGAKQLLELCFPLAGLSIGVAALGRIVEPAAGIDAIMNAHYRKLRAYCVIPPLAISPNDQETSDTVPYD